MALAFLLALQAAAPAAPPQRAHIAIDWDLALYRPADDGFDPLGRARGCASGGIEAIVVCGRRPSGGTYPLDEMAEIFMPRPIVAEARIAGNLTGRAYLDAATMPNGMVSNRILVGIGTRF